MRSYSPSRQLRTRLRRFTQAASVSLMDKQKVCDSREKHRMLMRLFLALTLVWSPAWSQDGSAIYQTHCAVCHDTPQGRTPPVSSLRAMPVSVILDALTNGVMKVQAAGLSSAEKTAVATFLGSAKQAETARSANTCSANAKPSHPNPGTWNAWGVDPANTRFQSAREAGLTAAQLPKLRLKWAFGLGDNAEPRSQPVVAKGTVYVGAAQLYALDAESGCTRWVFAPDAPVRSGLAIGRGPGQRPTIFFGNQKGEIYAVNAADGKLAWKTHLDDNFAAMVTSTPVLYGGVLYAGLSSYEEVLAGSPKYPCCSFRGSVVALNPVTGAQIWKTYTIAAKPQSIAGTTFFGPSGAGVWSSPTIDKNLNRLYVATGDNYSEPATDTSDAIIAMALDTGKLLWKQQATQGDIYNVGCDPEVRGACPETHGHDFDFGQPPILVTLRGGKRALVIGQKSGVVHAFDPDAEGKPMWSKRIGEGGTLGGIQWGSAANNGRVYVALSDLRLKAVPDKTVQKGYRLEADGTKGGGLFALDIRSGDVVWNAKPTLCGERNACSPSQSAAVSGIPAAVFSGSLDGHLRAYAEATGTVLWDEDTEKEFRTVNGEKAQGGSLDVGGAVIAGGAVYVMSGYGRYGGKAGNVLLAYGL